MIPSSIARGGKKVECGTKKEGGGRGIEEENRTEEESILWILDPIKSPVREISWREENTEFRYVLGQLGQNSSPPRHIAKTGLYTSM